MTNPLCSGGNSYFYIKPDGNMYTCVALGFGGNEKYRVGNIRDFDFEKNKMKLTRCQNFACLEQCDPNMAIIQHDGQEAKPGMWLSFNRSAEEQDKRKVVLLNIVINNKCNYHCHYCAHYGYEGYQNLDVSDWLAMLNRAAASYEYGIAHILGGEPTTYKGFLEIMEWFNDHPKWTCLVITNGSASGIFRQLCERSFVDPKRMHISFSIHPSHDAFNYEKTFASLRLLKEKGFSPAVTLVGHPAQIYIADRLKADADSLGIPMQLFTPYECGPVSETEIQKLESFHGRQVNRDMYKL